MLNYEAIGRKISYYRKAKGYTQSVLAEKIDISECYMSKIECGRIKVSLKRLDQIAEQLEIDIVMLLSDTNVMNNSYGFTELLDVIKTWTPEQKEYLLTLVRCADEQIFSVKKK